MAKPTGKRVKGSRPVNRILSTFGLKYTELGKYLRWATLPARGKKKILNMRAYKSLTERIKSGNLTDADRQTLFRLFKENFGRLIGLMKSGDATGEEKGIYRRILIDKFEKDLAIPKQTLTIFTGYNLADLADEFLKSPTKGIALKIAKTLKHYDQNEPLLRFRLAAALHLKS